MNRNFLRWFYIVVQFAMLAVSIPKVATLFHAYDRAVTGPLIGGVDLRSWFVGIAIDLTATFTTWAAMSKFEANRRHMDLIAPAVIIFTCTALSVIANFEDAAGIEPAQYAHINLFAEPAQLINPMLISAPPILVFLLIILVPSVLATPRIKSAEEIERETDQAEAIIKASARLKEVRAAANAKVRSAQLEGLAQTVATVARRGHPGEQEEPDGDTPPPLPTGPGTPALQPVRTGTGKTPAPSTIRLVPGRQPKAPQKVAARARRSPKESVEAKVRASYVPGMSVSELQRASGVSRSSANRWMLVFQREAGQYAQ